MLRRNNVLDYSSYLLNPIGGGSESEVFITTFGALKLFRNFLHQNIANEKLKMLEFFDEHHFCKKFPEIIVADELLFLENELKGYIMAYVSGISFKEEAKNASYERILYLSEKIESLMKILHSYNIYLQDLTEDNIKVKGNIVYLIDNDSCYIGMRTIPKYIAVKYPCPYSSKVSKQSNLFTLRLITILALTGDLNFIYGKYHLTYLKRRKLRKKIMKLNIPMDTKKKLVQALSKKGFEKLDYMF
ncbi:MAG: hypothetical protein Q4D02_05415 [Clostridia bacterium]|nr:hypothetical protein [Clostridia bacterium]